jgi:hypothetical protein
MRDLRTLNQFRDRSLEVLEAFGTVGDHANGVFHVPTPFAGATKIKLKVIASGDGGWDHVSVSLPTRCPIWAEMEHIKRMFFADDETAMQLHVPPGDHINHHPFTLHLWRPHAPVEIPRPPWWMVGPKKEPTPP